MATARRWAALEALVSRRRAGGALSYRTVEYAHGGVALCGCAVRRRGAEEVRGGRQSQHSKSGKQKLFVGAAAGIRHATLLSRSMLHEIKINIPCEWCCGV